MAADTWYTRAACGPCEGGMSRLAPALHPVPLARKGQGSCKWHAGKSMHGVAEDYACSSGAPGVSGSEACGRETCVQHPGSAAADAVALSSASWARLGELTTAFAELGA